MCPILPQTPNPKPYALNDSHKFTGYLGQKPFNNHSIPWNLAMQGSETEDPEGPTISTSIYLYIYIYSCVIVVIYP